MGKRIYCFSMICILLCVSLIGCRGKNKSDNNYTFGQYTVAYGDVNLHLDSTCKADFGKDNIILVHGLTYSSHEFDINYKDYSLVRFLADKGYTVWGDSDPYLNYELIDRMYQELSEGSARKIIGGAAHCAYIEKPYYHDFHNTLIKFLSSR